MKERYKFAINILLILTLGVLIGACFHIGTAANAHPKKLHHNWLQSGPHKKNRLSNWEHMGPSMEEIQPFSSQGDMMPSQDHLQNNMFGKQGNFFTTPMGRENSSISVVEANAIEEQLVGNLDTSLLQGNYPIVDTGLENYYSNSTRIDKPSEGEIYYGQDANYSTNAFSYTDNGDGTVTDNVTGLMWQQDPGNKMTWVEAVELLKDFKMAGYTDWRLPTIKELYSLINFSGETESIPYIDTHYFTFNYGDATGERAIDSQYATSTIYDSDTMFGNTTVFGVNFADGRIKGYPIDKAFYVMLVRGNESYGLNHFVDNGDGTITDYSTGLMWLTYDSGYFLDEGAMDWDDALSWTENLEYAGYQDWKLPDAKELQSIVDYTRSPDTTNSPAIDPLFEVTEISSLDGSTGYPYYWSSTTHLDGRYYGEYGVYVAFGEALGEMFGDIEDVHGAGAQRSDPKTGGKSDYPISGHGPQGDVQCVFNYVRAVRVIK